MPRVAFVAVIFLLINGCAPTPLNHHLQFRSPDDPPMQVATVYRVTADLRPESLLVHARVDIDFTNTTHDTLTSLTITLGRGARIDRRATGELMNQIDSLSINGAAVRIDTNQTKEVPRTIPLPSPLLPNERVALDFILTAHCETASPEPNRATSSIICIDWLPRIAGDHTNRMNLTNRHTSDYEIQLAIDSGWLIAAPGELLNDKELLGMIPNFDTVMTDVIHQPFTGDGYTFSRLPAKEGRDRYHWTARNCVNFDFMAVRGYLLDRGRRALQTVEVYYPPQLAERRKGVTAKNWLTVLDSATQETGRPLSSPLRIVVTGDSKYWLSDNVLVLPE